MSRWYDFAKSHPRAAGAVSWLRSCVPPLNFITIHYAYFIIVSLVSSLIFWGSSNPAWSISYTDSLYLVVSAMTEAGLNTVNLSQMTTWQQTLLFLLIIFGSSIWVSIWTVLARKHVFEQRFHDIVRAERMRKSGRSGSAVSLSNLQRFVPFRKAQTTPNARLPLATASKGDAPEVENARPMPRRAASLSEGNQPLSSPSIPADINVADAVPPRRASRGVVSEASAGSAHIVFADSLQPDGAGMSTATQHHDYDTRPTRRHGAAKGIAKDDNATEFSVSHFLNYHESGRNAQFHGLSREERSELGGCEYRALRVLAVIVPLYFFLWQALGCIALGAWINNYQSGPPLENGINPWWLGVFNGASAFNNSGMSLLDANMIPFQNSKFVLITMGLMILAGNTAYPIFLRLIIWSLLKLLTLTTSEDNSRSLKDTFRFILHYPRRVYTNLFPSRPTWWLLFMLILLNSIDWVAFELLNLGNPAVESIPTGSRVLDGLFQAIAVRSGGFYVIAIPSLYIGLQVLYVIMMYISVYPVVITMRHSNVYEERSLGIYAEDSATESDPEMNSPSASMPSLGRRRTHSGAAASIGRAFHRTFTWQGVGARPPAPSQRPESRISFISQQIHGQLAHDIWWLVLAILIIVTIETSNFLADPITFSVFNVIFEVVSGYGSVGISVGLPNAAYSFSGAWHTASKLVLCLVFLRGRHRGLPVALDRAVRLPGEELHQEEDEDYRIRRSMTNRRMSVDA
ncbi:cation transport protein-domain-containing protein [Podospora appendiculata]|uniref:Potassium transport protein n=1 Tax=Podospora appendiculata TaxID=314037 RepID=A0AAE0XBZ5_9PEZI|nr:cation transport protein-domain-containing protein [Podospora appendiculata]